MHKRNYLVSNAVVAVVLGAFSFCLGATALDVEVAYETSPFPILGFNDPALGAERQAAFQKAVDIWETHLQGTITVRIDARFIKFGAPPPLAGGIPTSASANLSGLPLSQTWYYSALASQLRGVSSPASSGPYAGFHMAIAVEDSFNTGPVGSGIWYYGLDGNPPGSDYDFVSAMLHELGHCLGMMPLININTGEWANILTGTFPPPGLAFGDIFSRQLTRTPNPVGGANDIDFWDMTFYERFFALTSNQVYWKGPAVKAAAEFTPPPPIGFPLVNSKGEVQMNALASSGFSLLTHWDGGHADGLLMSGQLNSVSDDIDATKEVMIDIGWSVNTPPASGPIAWVDFGFAGEEFGTELLPFSTFGKAATFVTAGGTVNVKTGTSTETPTVAKEMTVNAVGGTASIGVSARSAEPEDNEQSKTGFVSRQEP